MASLGVLCAGAQLALSGLLHEVSVRMSENDVILWNLMTGVGLAAVASLVLRSLVIMRNPAEPREADQKWWKWLHSGLVIAAGFFAALVALLGAAGARWALLILAAWTAWGLAFAGEAVGRVLFYSLGQGE